MAKRQPIRIQKTRVTNSPAARPFKTSQSDEVGVHHRLIDNLYDAIIITQAGGDIIDVNTRAPHFFLFSREELLGLNITDLIARSSDSLVQMLERNVQASRHTLIQAQCIRKNKSRFVADMSVSQFTDGNVTGLCFSLRDITRKKQEADQLDTQHNAVQNAGSGMIIADMKRRIQYANPAVYEMLGMQPEDLTLLGQLWDDEKEAGTVLESTLAGNVWNGELTTHTGSGNTIFLQASVAPNLSATDEQVGLIITLMDITEQKTMEEELQRAHDALQEQDLDRARLDTVEALAHEMNSPLQILLTMVEIDKNPEYKAQLDRILEIMKELHDPKKLQALSSVDGSGRPAFRLPAATAAGDTERILVADDEQVLREIFKRLINTFLPEKVVDLAANGSEALDSFREHHHGVVLMDLAMPGLSGEDAFEEIEAICDEKQWQVPSIIFCTGFMPSGPLQTMLQDHPLHMLLNKPVSKDTLINAIESRLALDYFKTPST